MERDLKSLESTRTEIRKETRRCLSEILNEVRPPPPEIEVDPGAAVTDKLTLEDSAKIEDIVITKSSDSDESKTATFQHQKKQLHPNKVSGITHVKSPEYLLYPFVFI